MSDEDAQISVQKYKPLGEVFSALGSVKRLQSYVLLANGDAPIDVADALDISRSGLQNYINDFKERELLEKDGKSLIPTETGEWLLEEVESMEDEYEEYRQSALRDRIEELSAFASSDSDEFIKQLIRDHPDEVRDVYGEEFGLDDDSA
ncbi:hypothetical protein [Halosegnis marinus]|uniref:Uncharacterized protein n=1 Tax=Halosegnis marinus TaxID=3034023 RepID=A0ABD5ZSY8_9EURY|nr:hypothetical protein [Halosegnis sp. DT85]